MYHTTFWPHQIHPSVFIARGAIIVGDVTLSEDCSVWFNAVLRGDTEPIMIGARTNIQESAVFHTDPGDPVLVGADVTVGHGAIIHGATVANECIVGMRAVLLNGAKIGERSIVGAGSLVTEGKEYPPESLIIGSPARAVRTLAPDEFDRIRKSAQVYVRRAQAFRAQWHQSAAPAPDKPK